jgi:cytoskeletal protein CcmA (bactofilin family)
MEIISFGKINKNSSVTGEIHAEGDFYLAGELKGNITLSGSGTLTLESTGKINGHVVCRNACIMGEIQGSIHVSEKLLVKASGNIQGKVSAASMEVYPGSLLEMSLTIE